MTQHLLKCVGALSTLCISFAVACAPAADAATDGRAASTTCNFVGNYIAAYAVKWGNGGGGLGCYSIDADQEIYQSSNGSTPSIIPPGNGRATKFYGSWENNTNRRICVITSANNTYFDTYGLDGSGWHGWTKSSNPSSDCPNQA